MGYGGCNGFADLARLCIPALDEAVDTGGATDGFEGKEDDQAFRYIGPSNVLAYERLGGLFETVLNEGEGGSMVSSVEEFGDEEKIVSPSVREVARCHRGSTFQGHQSFRLVSQ